MRASSMTGSNRPVVKSSTSLVAPRRRSIAFGVKTIERPARAGVGLAAQQVEVRRGRRRTRDGHVVLGAHLQVALDAGGRVVGALALVAVGEQQHDARALAPLLLGRGDELVDDGLGAVGEVAELRLPQHERVGALDRVAVLEAHRGVLAEQRVVDPELRLVVGEVRAAAATPGRSRGRAARRGAARRCRGGSPGRRGAPGCPRAGASRRRAARRSPSRSCRCGSCRGASSSSCWIFGCTVKPAGLLSNASPMACTTSVETPVVSSSPETTSSSRVRSVAPTMRDRAGLRRRASRRRRSRGGPGSRAWPARTPPR